MAKNRTEGQGVVLGLSEVEAYAVMSAIKTTLEVESDFDQETSGFGAFVPQKFDQRTGPLASRPHKQRGASQIKPF